MIRRRTRSAARLPGLAAAALAVLLAAACSDSGTTVVTPDSLAATPGGSAAATPGGSAAATPGGSTAATPGGSTAVAPQPPTPPRPAAVVSLGDSFISGEAGRWAGNSGGVVPSGFNVTDRSCSDAACSVHRLDTVYLDGTGDGCHRSDVAEIRSAAIPGAEPVNLACSGAATADVLRATSGGRGLDGEPPQADQLADVARRYDVKLVVLSIGGNDLGFADVVSDCFLSYVGFGDCQGREQPAVEARMPAVMAQVARAVDDIRAVMSEAGYQPRSYRLVLQSYPSPVPRASENRYPAIGLTRSLAGGCPVSNRDSDWARDRLVPQLSDGLKAVAAQEQAQFLDLRDALQGREVCATASALVTGTPSAARNEWVRSAIGLVQGSIQEVMHPNAFGQRALGRCLALLYSETGPAYSCHNTPGLDDTGMTLAPS